jgi:hypothetical protein
MPPKKQAASHSVKRWRLAARSGHESGQLNARFAYEPASLLLTVVNVAFAFVPSAVIATRQTTMINANMTAYSTAVGPSSRFKKLTTC